MKATVQLLLVFIIIVLILCILSTLWNASKKAKEKNTSNIGLYEEDFPTQENMEVELYEYEEISFQEPIEVDINRCTYWFVIYRKINEGITTNDIIIIKGGSFSYKQFLDQSSFPKSKTFLEDFNQVTKKCYEEYVNSGR